MLGADLRHVPLVLQHILRLPDLAPGLVRGFQRFTSQKNVFRPMGWGKLAISFWCDGLVRERLDRRRTANGAAYVAAAIATG